MAEKEIFALSKAYAAVTTCALFIEAQDLNAKPPPVSQTTLRDHPDVRIANGSYTAVAL